MRAHVPSALWLPCEASTRNPSDPVHVISPSQFAAVASHLQLHSDDELVVYDAGSGIAAARVWWTLRYYGALKTRILDGGWFGYIAAGGRVATQPSSPSIDTNRSPLSVAPQRNLIAELADVREAVDTTPHGGGAQLVDMRTRAEYEGNDLRGLRFAGHPPGAVNIPHADLLAPDRTYKPAEELRALFEAAGLDPHRRQITYCLGGMRAAMGMAALEVAGYDSVRNYDSSMEEWANTPGLPLVVGPSPR